MILRPPQSAPAKVKYDQTSLEYWDTEIEIGATLTKGMHQFSVFELELKFGCSFSFFRCFVVNIDSYDMDKNAEP